MTASRVDRADLQAENDIYKRLGRVLLEMLHPEHLDSWTEILLHVEHVLLRDAPEAYTMETEVVLGGEQTLPLVARPQVLDLSRELQELCQEQSGKKWKALDFRVLRDAQGARFQSRYTYPDVMH
jgi:hypothetical protein